MDNSYLLMRILLIMLLVTGPLPAVMADDDYVEARRLLDSGEILPLEVILKNVRQVFPGRVLEVELEQEDSMIVYEIEILGEDGVIEELQIDAKTGKQLFSKEDD